MFNLKGNKKIVSTQEYLPISYIEQDAIVLNNGALRGALRASPINFDLKSEMEQNAVIAGYQAFLNSLQFSIQIVVRSKRLDLERYLVKLESETKNITNNLLLIQTQDYIGFIRRLIQIANIMSKQFYIVIGYDNLTSSKNSIANLLVKNRQIHLTEAGFKSSSQELTNRINIVAGGLSGMGITAKRLATQELIELFYNIYNPEESMAERLVPVGELEADVIETNADSSKPQDEPLIPNS